MRHLFITIFSLFLTGCGVPQSDFDKVISENIALKAEIDTLRNGEQRLVATIEQAFADRAYDKSKKAFVALKEFHPQSKTIPKYTKLMATIKAREQALVDKNKAIEKIARKKREAEEKEIERLKNLNNTGIWQVTHYVDDFGEPTKDGYIRNLSKIRGKFSNSATQDSSLDVRIMINSKTNIDIMLYEYAGNNPVKAYSPDKYSVQLQDKNGTRHKLIATNYGDRLSFGPKHSRIIWNALLKGGRVSIRIYEIDTPTTQYAFEIKNSDYFQNATRLLKH